MSRSIPQSRFFPPASEASEEGILLVGGYVIPDILVDALVHGVFPWPVYAGEPEDYSDNSESHDASQDSGSETEEEEEARPDLSLFERLSPEIRNASWNGFDYGSLPTIAESGETLCWWSPDPRGIFELDKLHIPTRLRRTMRSSKFQVTFDQAFPEVMLGCAFAGARQEEGSWISKEFFCGYCRLFELGLAHSAECWKIENNESGATERRLVGGVYGVAINGFFDGESMFSVETDASKVALFSLLTRLAEHQFKLFDLQIINSHTQSLGAVEIPRAKYLKRLEDAVLTPATF